MTHKIKTFIYIASACLCILSCTSERGYVTFTGFAQGGTYSVKANLNGIADKGRTSTEDIGRQIDSILAAIDNSISGYNKKSLISRFNSGESISPDDIFIDIYSRAYDIYEETDGVVDAASAPLFDLWGFGFTSDSLPSAEALEKALKASGMKRLRKDISSASSDGKLCGKDVLKEDGPLPELNYNAIAQGYSCDLVAGHLRRMGVKDMLVDIGEIYCEGRNPSGKSWTLGIDRPVDGNNEPGVQLQGIFKVPEGPHGVVTSGNYRKFYIHEGKKYAHTIDTKTGLPVQHSLLSATIVADDAITADAYATFCMAIGLTEAKEMIESRPDLEGCLIYDDDGVFRTWCSEGFILEEL